MWSEQRTHNSAVTGSSPILATSLFVLGVLGSNNITGCLLQVGVFHPFLSCLDYSFRIV